MTIDSTCPKPEDVAPTHVRAIQLIRRPTAVPLSRPAISFITVALIVPAVASSQTVDTVRVGTHALRVPLVVSDTLDGFTVTPDGRVPTGLAPTILRRTRERLGGVDVIHLVSETGPSEARSRYDYFLHAITLQPLRTEQHTPIDSAIMEDRGACVTGWVHLQNQPRRTVPCDRMTDRFATANLEVIVAGLPLRAGAVFAIATRNIVDAPVATVRVTGSQAIVVGDRTFDTWQVEWVTNSQWGTFTSVFSVDKSAPRVLQTRRISVPASGPRREFLIILRNP